MINESLKCAVESCGTVIQHVCIVFNSCMVEGVCLRCASACDMRRPAGGRCYGRRKRNAFRLPEAEQVAKDYKKQ